MHKSDVTKPDVCSSVFHLRPWLFTSTVSGPMTHKDYSRDMSVKEPHNQANHHRSVAVARSHSFGGMANPRIQSAQSTPILGQNIRRSPQYVKPSPAAKTLGFSFKKSPKIPKIPRPSRAALMFESVKKGIREFIVATEEDIALLQGSDPNTSTAQGKCFETDKQVKVAERHLKRLEFHLSTIDELHDCYLLNQQLREGVRTMARAYVASPGRTKDPLNNVKYGYKECTQTMCAIEAQLESMMGTFHCKLKGMVGFARLCPGDVFEVTLRYGSQKWKSKGRVEKDSSQKWEVPDFVFKALLGDIISIKAVEVRSFKSIVLGLKNCETKDLFSAHPQMMTVSVNTNGSLKLSVIITWNPLEGVDESAAYFDSIRTQGARKRPVSLVTLNGQYSPRPDQGGERRLSNPVPPRKSQHDDSFGTSHSDGKQNGAHARSGLGVVSNLSAQPRDNGSLPQIKESPVSPVSPLSHPKAVLASAPNLNSSISPAPTLPPHRFDPPPPRFSGMLPAGAAVSRDEAATLEEALSNLSTALEDFQGHYTELQKLEEVVSTLECMLRRRSRSSSQSSNVSVSIESALGAFDFLNTEDVTDSGDIVGSPETSRRSSFDHILASPESTAKTADSGIESLAKRLSEDTQFGSSLGSSPEPASTGNEQVDQALMHHLVYAEKLLENLGSFGPLKCKEIYSVDKLQKQAVILEELVMIAKCSPTVDLFPVMNDLTTDKQLKEFWTKAVEQNVLFVSMERLSSVLEQKFASKIKAKYDVQPAAVCREIVSRVVDLPTFDTEKSKSSVIVTLHQFMHYFKEEGGLKYVETAAGELWMTERLQSRNVDIVIKTILTLHKGLPPASCLRTLGILTMSESYDIKQSAVTYLKQIEQRKPDREKAMVAFVEFLEDKDVQARAGACVALSLLRASESINQLVYLCQTDSSLTVRARAKDALYSLGEEGKKAYGEAQLGTHGFQGIQVKKKFDLSS
ncbi:rho family-interacting cell polarization regulator 1-like isoform X2 [Liolophura sinensis]|uniref:rho family-interacting cell polarization regulator 1-like isoform X2 n=1 Tax=Liolophura sinensis TaxID=3198878 RepID=UPI00315912A8